MKAELNNRSKSKISAQWPSVAVILAVCAAQFFHVPFASRALERVGLLLFDSYQRAAPRPYEAAPVRVVDIDDETIRRFGQWPWPRTDIAKLTQIIADAGASVIAFDIVFSEADRTSPPRLALRIEDPSAKASLARLPDNDAILGKVFAVTPTVTGFFLTRESATVQAEPKAGIALSGSPPEGAIATYSNAILPLPELTAAAAGNGFVSLSGDSDAIVRRVPLIAKQGNVLLPSLSVDALRTAQQAGSIIVKTSDASGEIGGRGDIVSLKIGQFEVPTTAAGDLWMHYTKPVPQRVVPAWKLLSGVLTPEERAKLFEGHIIFIGTGAIGLRDLVSTPVQDRDLGVNVHAQAVEQMILGKFLIRPDWARGLEVSLLLVLGLGMALALPRLGAVKGALLGGAAVAGIMGGSWAAYSQYQYLLDPTYPVIGLALAYLLQTVTTYYREERQRAYIHQAFDRYLSPELVKRIADDPAQLQLGGEERDMTVLFCDIRSFSAISEGMKPNEIIGFLIRFLTPMTNLLLERKATIDKYIGDAILAFWNAPLDDADQYRNAARAALEMGARLKTLNAEMQAQSAEPWPGDVKIGIGLNSGSCCVGNMGSEQRLSYSLIGDTVNLASRIEGLTKYYGIQIAIGSALQSHVADFASVVIDRVRVVGRETRETVHVLIGDETVASDAAFCAFANRHKDMLEAYYAQNWEKAAALLDQNDEAAESYGLTKVYGLYRDRILIFAANAPGAAWDGVFIATEK